MENKAKEIFLKDYQPPSHLFSKVKIDFDLHEESTSVATRIQVKKNPASKQKELSLDGDPTVELNEVLIDGTPLKEDQFTKTEDTLTLFETPDSFELQIKTTILPHKNKSFSGLYKTKSLFCTQMEAQGFRRVTYFLDRPDTLSLYEVTIEADANKYPMLLSNGDRSAYDRLNNGRHKATWVDPHPKPCYLFALVAGDLGLIKDSFKTQSGRNVSLEIYVDKGNEDRAQHAMQSLKESMIWDEQVYGCEYDLDTYMIVAVDDFNMGAMENKGLNIFNTKYVLADSKSATDNEILGIQSVIGHEYFHNWSGNRVTCRDWFQLSLKEGLTVFRDQEFSADLNSRAVQRIDDVATLRGRQFPEDAGGMAHPVRPASYIAIDNFYTTTVYLKGAEVIRMLQTLLGRDTFIAGVKNYFQKHDGQAVTCDDFISALEETSQKDLGQFKNWYSQTGTPKVSIKRTYDSSTKTLQLTFAQSTQHPVTKNENKPYVIPVKMGLLDQAGKGLALDDAGNTEVVLDFKESTQAFSFNNVPEDAVPSFLRDFSAPVWLESELSEDELLLLAKHDPNAFVRWESMQNLFSKVLLEANQTIQSGGTPEFSNNIIEAFRSALSFKESDDLSFLACLLRPPSVSYIQQKLRPFSPGPLEMAYDHFKTTIQTQLNSELTNAIGQIKKWPTTKATRDLKSTLMTYYYWKKKEKSDELFEMYTQADNMTEKLSAFIRLCDLDNDVTKKAIDDFQSTWKNDALVMNKWFAAQALSISGKTPQRVIELGQSPHFDATNPNNLYNLYMNFATANPFRFHQPDGGGYQVLTDAILATDKNNPQVSARLANVFNDWSFWEDHLKNQAQSCLQRIHQTSGVSKNLYEIVHKYLSMGEGT